MKQYHDLCKHILEHGNNRGDRTGTGTKSVFGYQMRFNLEDGFPLVTTKETNFRLIAEELIWFLNGSTKLRDLLDKKVNIWNGDAYRWFNDKRATIRDFIQIPYCHVGKKEFLNLIRNDYKFNNLYGDLGPIYGKQWRNWSSYKEVWGLSKQGYIIESIDQISNVIESIKKDPYGRRHIVSAWNPADIEKMALPPCHILFQFYVADGKLSCQLYQRSGDVFLGVPFNIASYALLVHIIALECNLGVGEFIHTLGDAHIYNNHIDKVELQLTREPLELPTISINKKDNVFDYDIEDFTLLNYNHHEKIKGDLSN